MSVPAWRWLYDIPLPANVAAAIADQPLQEIAEFPAPQLELLEQHELKMLRPKPCHRSSVRVNALAVIDAGRKLAVSIIEPCNVLALWDLRARRWTGERLLHNCEAVSMFGL